MESLILMLLANKFRFTYGTTGKEVTDPVDLANIVKSLAELDLIIQQLLNVKQNTAKS